MRKTKLEKLFPVLTALLLVAAAAAAAPGSDGGKDRIKVRSTVLSEDRELRVSTPAGYDSSGAAYPALYVLDAEANFSFTVEIVRYLEMYKLIPGMLVVGIDNTNRTRDMTPSPIQASAPRYAGAGGADRFLKFLAEEAIPAVEKRFRTTSRRALVGHSLSALLVIHALLRNPDLFASYIAISPSVWWNEFEIYSRIQAFYKSRTSLPKDLFVSLADESEREPERYTQLQDAFEKSAPADLRVQVRFYKQENHISTAVVATLNALSGIFGAEARARARG